MYNQFMFYAMLKCLVDSLLGLLPGNCAGLSPSRVTSNSKWGLESNLGPYDSKPKVQRISYSAAPDSLIEFHVKIFLYFHQNAIDLYQD